MGAHAEYDQAYLTKCWEYLQKTSADCVGGVCEMKPSQPDIWAETIAAVLAHPLGAGNAKSRLLQNAQWVDTVPFGAYRREVFERLGLFDERINGSEDLEFNYRLRYRGGRIYMTPEIRSWYYPRATLLSLWKQHFLYGFSNIKAYWLTRRLFSWRHYGPLILVLLLIASAVIALLSSAGRVMFSIIGSAYIFGLLIGAASLALKQGFRYFFTVPLVAGVIHLSHGFGALWGVIHGLKEYCCEDLLKEDPK